MNNEGKYPFEGTPKLRTDFSEEKDQTENPKENNQAEEKACETPAPAPKPSWLIEEAEYQKTEVQLAYIIEQPRATDNRQQEQNYDAIQDNNINVGIELKSEWDKKVWEAPTPEIGED